MSFTPPPEDVFPTTYDEYFPSGVPGGRAPHVWLDDKREMGGSLYDRMGHGFTLLRLNGNKIDVAAFTRAAETRGIPLTVLDVAHNPEGMRALTESLPDLAAGRSPVVAVVSVLDDKDAAGMLTELMPACDQLVLTTTQNPRVLPPATLKSLATQLSGPPTEVVWDPWRALARARELAGRDGFVVVTGSQYLVGDLLAGGRRERASSL